MSWINSEDLQRRIQLFSSNSNQRCLLAWRTHLQWILPTLPPASLPSGFRSVAASPQPRQMSLVPPKQALAYHGVLFKGQKLVSASRQVLELRSNLLFQLSAAMQNIMAAGSPCSQGRWIWRWVSLIICCRSPWGLLWAEAFFSDSYLSQLGTLTISCPPLLICSPALAARGDTACQQGKSHQEGLVSWKIMPNVLKKQQ